MASDIKRTGVLPVTTALCIGAGAVVYGASVARDEQRRDYRD